MSKKAKAKPVDRAEPTIKQPMRNDAQRMNVATARLASMTKSPLWAGSPDVQTAAKGWTQSVSDLGGNAAVVAGLRAQLGVAEAKQLTLRRSFRACKRQVLSAVSIVCEGSADAVTGFSFDVVTRVAAALLAAVDGITSTPGALPGQAKAMWPKGLARHGFLVQHATDPANVATYSAVIPCTRTKYTLSGASPSGSNVYFRLAAVDPRAATGQTPWSSWIVATVR